MNEAREWLKQVKYLEELLSIIYVTKISREERIRYMTKLKSKRNEIFKVISLVDDYVSQCILIERYINLKSWKEIADKLYFSTKYVKNELHSKALRKVAVILNESKQNNR